MTKRAALAFVCLALVVSSARAADPKLMTIEDALSMRDVGAPQWSPDGKLVAFTVTEWNRKEDRRDAHIYVVAAATVGAQPVRLTNGERGETQPQWSPDGTRLAFLANRDRPAPDAPTPTAGAPRNQIWIITVGGGEAEKVTDEEAGVAQFRWSPDSRRIAYVVRDTPQDKAERDKKRKDKFDAIVVDSGFIFSHLWALDLDTKAKRRITEGSFTVADPQWSPDGQRIAYVAATGGAQDSSFTDISSDRNTDIFIIAATTTGAQARRLTTNPGTDASPRWSHDGKLIAYVSSVDPQAWATKTDLLIVAPGEANAAPRNLTGNYDESVASPAEWSPDDRSLYVGGLSGVYGQLLRVRVAGGEPQAVFESPGAYTGVDVSPDGKTLAFIFEDARQPKDLWLASSTGRGAKQLTTLNPQLKDFARGATEVLKWKSADGLDIEGVLIKPANYEAGKRYPTILQVHGGPYARFAYGFEPRAQIYAANGYAVLMPNPRGSVGYGHKFSTANVGDWGGKDFQDVMAGVDEVIKRGVADPERLAVMGGSYGGFMTFWTITQTDRFKAAIGHAGISDWYSFYGQSDVPGLMEYGFGGLPWTAREAYVKWSPMSHVAQVKTPLMITHGEQDRRVPIQQAEEYYRALRKRGNETIFVRYPREGHGITEPNHQIDLLHRQIEWLDQHLKNSAAAKPAGN